MNGLTQALGRIYTNLEEPKWVVSENNVFVMIKEDYWGYITRPNWALIIPLVLIALASIIALSVYLYRRWQRTHCIPVRLAGKVCYAKPGQTVRQAIEMPASYDCDWLGLQKRRLEDLGFVVDGWYTDVNLQIPLDLEQPIFAPVIIYPKVKKK